MKTDTLYKLRRALVRLDLTKTDSLVKESLVQGLEPIKILESMRSGMEEIGKKFEKGEYFVSELIMAGEIMKRSLEVLKPHQKANSTGTSLVVLGTIVGDLHDIGKEIIKSLLISAGFEVYDLGIDVPPEKFVAAAKETGAKIIGISALLSTSISNTVAVVEGLKDAGIRDNVKVIVGGAVARSWMAEKYGVDAAVCDAVKGLEIIKKWAENK